MPQLSNHSQKISKFIKSWLHLLSTKALEAQDCFYLGNVYLHIFHSLDFSHLTPSKELPKAKDNICLVCFAWGFGALGVYDCVNYWVKKALEIPLYVWFLRNQIKEFVFKRDGVRDTLWFNDSYWAISILITNINHICCFWC